MLVIVLGIIIKYLGSSWQSLWLVLGDNAGLSSTISWLRYYSCLLCFQLRNVTVIFQ
jgi:hypothetical protein